MQAGVKASRVLFEAHQWLEGAAEAEEAACTLQGVEARTIRQTTYEVRVEGCIRLWMLFDCLGSVFVAQT